MQLVGFFGLASAIHSETYQPPAQTLQFIEAVDVDLMHICIVCTQSGSLKAVHTEFV